MSSFILPSETAARLFLGAQGLLEDPARPAPVLDVVRSLGFVQVDSIQTVARAHELILHARRDGYRPDQLVTALERDRTLFEAFTHDASLVPVAWYEQWRPRWRRDQPRIEAHPWWRNLLGAHHEAVCAHVLERIREEGPLGSAAFDHPEKRGPWWGWKPQKAALDYLWRTGRLAVAGRTGFQKRYDLPERVLPEAHARPEPDPDQHRDWACRSAAERLAVFTPRELAAFWDALDLQEARAWCEAEALRGGLVRLRVQGAGDQPAQPAWVLADWEARLAALPEAPDRIRLLAPFDPLLRDRARTLRRFGFDHRFEGFVPEARRRFGYYVLPILEGERLVGRLDAKTQRPQRHLEVKGLWWEPGIRATRGRLRALQAALERLAALVGVPEVRMPAPSIP